MNLPSLDYRQEVFRSFRPLNFPPATHNQTGPPRLCREYIGLRSPNGSVFQLFSNIFNQLHRWFLPLEGEAQKALLEAAILPRKCLPQLLTRVIPDSERCSRVDSRQSTLMQTAVSNLVCDSESESCRWIPRLHANLPPPCEPLIRRPSAPPKPPSSMVSWPASNANASTLISDGRITKVRAGDLWPPSGSLPS